MHNPRAVELLSNASDSELVEATKNALARGYVQYQIPENFEWVLSHEGQLALFRELGELKDYKQIRAIYHSLQNHNSNARNVLSAISDMEIQRLLDRARLTVSITETTSYESLKNLDSLTDSRSVTIPQASDLRTLIIDSYGFASAGLTKLILEKNKNLPQNLGDINSEVKIPPGTSVILPSLPRLGRVEAVPRKAFSGASCPACFTTDLDAIAALAELKTKGDNQTEPEVFAHIEFPAGQLQAVNQPSAADHGWYLELTGVNSIEPTDVNLISPVPIGVVDSGVDIAHLDLKNNFWHTPAAIADKKWAAGSIGYNFLKRGSEPWDELANSHGTHVSGLVVGEQISKWIPALSDTLASNIKLVELKIVGSINKFDSATAQNAIMDAFNKGVHIFNLSFEFVAYSEGMQIYLMQKEISANALFVVAAGNYGAISEGEDLDKNPERHMSFRRDDSLPLSEVIFVGALDEQGKMAKFSNYGKATVEIAAPGSNISSTVRNGGYGLLCGTSQAAPFVTLTAAILLAEIPSYTLPEVHQRIVDTCDWVPDLRPYVRDGCRLNIQKAVTTKADLLQLKSGAVLKGTVTASQIPLPQPSTNLPAPQYERVWFDDSGEITIVTKSGRFKRSDFAAPFITIQLNNASECIGQPATSCQVPVGLVRDITFRASKL